MPRTFPKRPCRFCRRRFRPDRRQGERQYACSEPECQLVRQIRNEEARLARDPGYFRGRGPKQRAYRRALAERKVAKPARPRSGTSTDVRDHVVHKVIALELATPQGDDKRVPDHDVHKALRAQLAILVGLVARLTRHDVHKATDFDLVALHDHGRRLLGGGGRSGTTRSG